MNPLPLFDYQAVAADVMAGRDRFGLHDEMGIGKTATTIGAVNRMFARRGIVVAPAMLRENWVREFGRFSTYPLRVCKGKNIHDYLSWQRGRYDVLVTSYEQATKWTREITKQCESLDFVAFDEAHYLKNANANRTAALLGDDADGKHCLLTWAEHAYHVTGTPMSNDPMDIYTFLRFAKAIDMGSDTFVQTFFHQTAGRYSSRNRVRPEMQETLSQLIQNNSIRRNHQQVGMELPPIWLDELLIEGNTIDIEEAMEHYPNMEEAIILAIELNDLSILDAAHIATIRRLVGKAKTEPYAKLLLSELKAGCGKRVVFCIHTEPLLYLQKYLAKHGYNFVVAYGATKESDRQRAVDAFMNDPNVHGFIGNIRVAGVGLTLTASADIDLLESDWSPAGNAQAIKRVHRYGQENAVRGRFITLADSIDVNVNQTVLDKTTSIAEVDGQMLNAAPVDSALSSAHNMLT